LQAFRPEASTMPRASRPRATLLFLAVLAGLAANAVRADVVSGRVTGAEPVSIKDAGGNVVAELRPGPYEILLPAGRYTAVCGSGRAAAPADFLSLSAPITVNFSCG
jgi:hypothetical protein